MQSKTFTLTTCSKLAVLFLSISFFVTSCVDRRMFVVYECDNKDFSVYVLNYSEKTATLDIDGRVFEILPNSRDFSKIKNIETNLDRNSKTGHSQIFIMEENKDNEFSIDLTDEISYFNSTSLPIQKLEVKLEDNVIFESRINNSIEDTFYLDRIDYAPEESEDFLTDGKLLFSESSGNIHLFIIWTTSFDNEKFALPATAPKYILIIPPDERVE